MSDPHRSPPSDYPLLDSIDAPDDVRALSEAELTTLATELREFLIDTVSQSGGHLAAGLGTVELTIALHHVFDTPADKLVWDVGHQAYPHKILTGRRRQMPGIRKRHGLSGFPRREESDYDSFGVGHAGTSVGGAQGMAEAFTQLGSEHQAIAIIGDGAMTAGMALEAMNHAGHIKSNLLVILNDNNMSISPNVGAISSHLTRLLSGPLYSSMREGGKRVLEKLPPVHEFARRAEEHVKGMVSPGTLFEEFGFNYFGPIDGHDIHDLVTTLENLKRQQGPRLLHIVTRKGKGYRQAEADPVSYHGVTPFNRNEGLKSASQSGSPTYTQVFSDWLCDMAAQDPRLVAITPAMREGSGLVEFARQYPARYYDVAIAEQHAVTLAAGLACEGLIPVVAIYSSFLQRGYDQLIHDVAIQNLPVVFAIDRGGLVGPDGATHAGSFDLSFMRCIPNMMIMAPANENECRQMLYTATQAACPVAVRYPRGKGPGVNIETAMSKLAIGKANPLRKGKRIALLNFGALLNNCEAVAERLDATLTDMRFIKPLDETHIRELAASHELLVTIEDNAVMGGAGSAVNELLSADASRPAILNLGLADVFLEHGSREELLTESGLDAEGIEQAILHQLKDAKDSAA